MNSRFIQIALFALTFLSFQTNSFSQNTYEDVVLIINSNSEKSVNVGKYFIEHRAIPLNNVIYVDCTDEEIIELWICHNDRGL